MRDTKPKPEINTNVVVLLFRASEKYSHLSEGAKMRRKTILALAVVWERPDGIVKLTLTLMKEIYSPLMMLVIFGGMFVKA